MSKDVTDLVVVKDRVTLLRGDIVVVEVKEGEVVSKGDLFEGRLVRMLECFVHLTSPPQMGKQIGLLLADKKGDL